MKSYYKVSACDLEFRTLKEAKAHINAYSASDRVSKYEYKGFIVKICDNVQVSCTEFSANVASVVYRKTQEICAYGGNRIPVTM